MYLANKSLILITCSLLTLRHSRGVGELLAGNILPITQILPRPPKDNEAATSSEDETSNLSVLESVLSKFDQPKYMHFFVKSKFISTGGGDNNKHDLTLAGVELIRFGLRFNIRHNVNNKLYQLVADSFSGWCLASCQQMMNDNLLGFSRYFLLENSMNPNEKMILLPYGKPKWEKFAVDVTPKADLPPDDRLQKEDSPVYMKFEFDQFNQLYSSSILG